MSTDEPSEEELRAAYEEEIKRIRVEHVVLENVVTLVNLGMRRTGLVPGTESERDPGQVQLAIESVRALLPVVESIAPEQVGPIRQALSQLQLGYVRAGSEEGRGSAVPGSGPSPESPGSPGERERDPRAAPVSPLADPAADPAAGESAEGKPGEPGPAQRSGRLWIPGQ